MAFSPRQQHGRLQLMDRLFILLVGISAGFITASLVFCCVVPATTLNQQTLLRTTSPTAHRSWNEIHVYMGDDEKIRKDRLLSSSAISSKYFEKHQWFSQVQQDELIARLLRFQRNGFFVDLAANDAIRISNTYALERDFGWNGIAIEPNPIYWSGLIHRPRATIVAAVVGGSARGTQTFRFPKDKAPQGGIVNTDERAKHPKEVQLIPTVSLQEVLQRYKAPKSESLCLCDAFV